MFVGSTFQVPYVVACRAITSASRSVSYYLSLSLVAWLRLLYIDAYACSHSDCILYLQHSTLLLGMRADGADGCERTAPEMSSSRDLSGTTTRRRSLHRIRRACQPLAPCHVRHLFSLRPWISCSLDHAGVVGR